jgi:hypothetical protein
MPHSSHKLSFRYFGPYQVIKKVGNVSYKLQLPEHSKIHPVLHVSLLKKAIKPTDQVITDIPVSLVDLASQAQPAQVIEERLIKRGRKLQPQVRVRWDTLPDSCSTWEKLYAMVNAFPAAAAWGQAALQGEGIVTTMYLTKALKENTRAIEHQRRKTAQQAGQPTTEQARGEAKGEKTSASTDAVRC